MVRVDDDVAVRHHSPGCEVRTLLLLLTILQYAIEGPYTGRYEIVGF